MEMATDFFLEDNKSLQRLLTEYETHGRLAIGYDFDDTVHDFHKRGSTHEKVINLLRDLKSIGCYCYCWTAHPNLTYVSDYLSGNDIPCDGINTDSYIPLGWSSRKPFYSALLDDRAGLLQVYNDLLALVNIIKARKWRTELSQSTLK